MKKGTIQNLFVFALMLLMCSYANAQQKSVSGRVSAADDGKPLQGVTVMVRGTNTAAITDSIGYFKLAAKGTDVLVVSYVGYTSINVPVSNQTVVEIILTPEIRQENDVVVIGYGTAKKTSVTGAVAKYKNERLDEVPASRLDQALQGKIAGVQIQNLSSEAGAEPKITIRGISSLNAGGNPLVVVDGHPVPDGLAFVNPADVESVEVLKDAASAAIYGSRGASGVILITTKSGSAAKPVYNFKIASGIRSPFKTHPIMSVSEYTELMFAEAALRAKDPTVSAAQQNLITSPERAMYVIEQSLLEGKGTDWQDEGLRNANFTTMQLGVSGGKKDLKYFISGSYQTDDAMIYNSSFDRYTLRTKLETNLGSRIKLNLNINPSFTSREIPAVNYTDYYRFYSYIPVRHTETSAAFVNQVSQWAGIRPGDYAQARHFNNRIYSGPMPDGSIWNSVSAVIPFNTQNNTPKSIMDTRFITNDDYRLLSSADINIKIAKGLQFKSLVSAFVAYTVGEDFAETNNAGDGRVNRGVFTNRLNIDLLNENTLNYETKIKKHSINALAGFTTQKTTITNAQAVGTGFPSDNIRTLNTALNIEPANTFTLKNTIGLVSVLGRIGYSFDDKYLLSASYRTDGSSYFSPGRKWGSFPSLSAGWILSKEKFLEKSKIINLLKLRASYGATGNNSIVEFAWLDLLFPDNYAFGNGTGTLTQGVAVSSTILPNPNITWERTFAYNLGIDVGAYNNRIQLAVDVYRNQTDKLLLRQAAMGFTGLNQTWNNVGQIRNSGVEIELTTTNIIRKQLKWKTMANVSIMKNKLLDIGGEAFQLNFGERNEIYNSSVGSPISQFFGYKTNGVWLSEQEVNDAKAVDKGTTLSNYFVPGGLKLVDINGDGKIDPNDRTNIGSPLPKFSWGLTNTLQAGAFDVSVLLQGMHGLDVINGDANYNESRRINRTYVNNRWVSAANPGDGKTPYYTNGFNWMLTDYVVESGAYIALREASVGYTLPAKWTLKAHLSSLRIYCSGQNLYTWMGGNYRGINPEARLTSAQYNSPLVLGYQRGVFPIARTVVFGIDINF